MSYILDAIRKSDQQRRFRMAPTLPATYAPVEVSRRRVPMFYIAVTVVLVAVGVAIGSLRPWEVEKPAATTEPVAVLPSPETSALPPPAPMDERPQVAQEPARALPAPKPVQAARTATAPMGGASERQAYEVTKSDTRRRRRTARVESDEAPPEPAPLAVPAKPDVAKQGVQEQKAMAMSDLPLSIRQELPSGPFSAHAYSRVPADRLIGINDRVLREGEYVAPGLLLERITPDGVIMTYKGYRFHRNAR